MEMVDEGACQLSVVRELWQGILQAAQSRVSK
jgi:hypothetical protein